LDTATSGGVSICFIEIYEPLPFFKINLEKGETFSAGSHLTYQYHFEDTPREAVRALTLTASLLLDTFFLEREIQRLFLGPDCGKLFSASSSLENSGKTWYSWVIFRISPTFEDKPITLISPLAFTTDT